MRIVVLSLVCLAILTGCGLRDIGHWFSPAPAPITEETLARDPLAPVAGRPLKEQLAYARQLYAKLGGTISGLQKEVAAEQRAYQASLARWCSMLSILGVVACGVLIYLKSFSFAGIVGVFSVGVFIACQLYAESIERFGPLLSGIVLLSGLLAISYEAWKHRAALKVVASPLPSNPGKAVKRLIARVQTNIRR